MSSISSTSAAQPYAPPRPPSEKNRLSSAIGNELSSGAITSTDATALTKAVDAIDASLKVGSSDGSTTSGTTAKTRLDPADAKGKIDGLIADQVTAGTLTSDQASTLKDLFAQGGEKGGRHGGVGGPHSGPPPSGADAAPSSGPTASTGSTSSTDDLLASFIQQLKSSQSDSTGYAASGASQANGNASALLFDFES